MSATSSSRASRATRRTARTADAISSWRRLLEPFWQKKKSAYIHHMTSLFQISVPSGLGHVTCRAMTKKCDFQFFIYEYLRVNIVQANVNIFKLQANSQSRADSFSTSTDQNVFSQNKADFKKKKLWTRSTKFFNTLHMFSKQISAICQNKLILSFWRWAKISVKTTGTG